MLIAAVGYLWREHKATREANAVRMETLASQQEAARVANAERLRLCEEEHKATGQRFLQLSNELAELRGNQAGVTKMAQDVLDLITEQRTGE